jgi:hypothetical protein
VVTEVDERKERSSREKESYTTLTLKG